MTTQTRLRIQNRTRPLAQPLTVTACVDFRCRLLGLMGRRDLAPDDGLLFRWPREGRADTGIHMLFMRFPIAVIWLNAAGHVVDARRARPWVDFLIPRAPAQYVLELHADRLNDFAIGDEITWHEI